MKNIKEKLKKIISRNIEIDIADLEETKKINEFRKFDSLAVVKIILQANKELNLKLEFEDFEQNKNVGNLLDNIKKKIK